MRHLYDVDYNQLKIGQYAIVAILIKFLRFLHLLILLYMVFGWAINSKSALYFYVIAVPVLMIHWQLNDGTCYLTNLEHKLKGDTANKGEQEGAFIRSLLAKATGANAKDWQLFILIYGVLIIGWMAGVYRYVQ